MAFAGSEVTAGRCVGVVVATGSSTEMGGMHRQMSEASAKPSPLQQKLDQFSEFLSKVC